MIMIIRYWPWWSSDPPAPTIHLGESLDPDNIAEGDHVYFECRFAIMVMMMVDYQTSLWWLQWWWGGPRQLWVQVRRHGDGDANVKDGRKLITVDKSGWNGWKCTKLDGNEWKWMEIERSGWMKKMMKVKNYFLFDNNHLKSAFSCLCFCGVLSCVVL